MTDHRIASVAFTHGQPSDDGLLTCTCDEVLTVGEWNDHRASQGLKPGDRINAGGMRYENTPWRARGAMAIRNMGTTP